MFPKNWSSSNEHAKTWYSPCSTFSLTTNCLKLKKTWKWCLPFLFRKTQRCHWLDEQLPSFDLLCDRDPPLHPKTTAQRRKIGEVAPSFGREDLSCVTAQGEGVHTPGGAGKWEHVPSTAPPKHPKVLLPLAMHVRYFPTDCEGNLDILCVCVCDRQTRKAGARPHAAKSKPALLP